MEKELILLNHAVSESNFHIQLIPAYGQDVFRDENVAELTLAYILEKMVELKAQVVVYNYRPDRK